MVTISITVGALLGLSILGYFTYDFRKKALDWQVKFESTRQFADEAAVRILKLEKDNLQLAEQVIAYHGKIVKLEEQRDAANKAVNKPVANATQTPPTMKPNNGNKKRGPKPRNNKTNSN